MESRAEDALERGNRCLLVAAGPPRPGGPAPRSARPPARPPVVSPVAYWFDGTNLWCTVPADGPAVAALDRNPVCAAHVPPLDAGGVGAVLTGRARVFSLQDPRGLLLHAPTLLTALTALGLGSAGRVAGRISTGLRSPARALPEGRVAVRVRVDGVRGVRALTPPPGIAPPLPPVVPPDVRRLVAGERQVVVAATAADGLSLQPAVWGAGLALTPSPGGALPTTGAATVVVQGDQDSGIALEGVLAGGRLRPERAHWWSDRSHGAAEVATDGAGGALGSITLPD